jgi:hypothetical protein
MCNTIGNIVGWGTPFGQRLKPHDNIAYIAYIIVLISILSHANPTPIIILITIRIHCPHCPHRKLAVSLGPVAESAEGEGVGPTARAER